MENTRDIQDNTRELLEAVDDGNIEVVEEILRNKMVDINGCDHNGDTALIYAVDNDHLDILRRLLEVPDIKLDITGNYDGDTALHDACGNKRVSMIQLLCQDTKCSPGVVNKKNIRGETPLMMGVRSGYLDIVRSVLEHPGTELGIKNNEGRTALHYASNQNSLDSVSIMKLLCQDSRCGPAVVNKKNRDGETALMIAVRCGHLDIVKELDKEGTDFFTKDKYGRTLIEMARMENRVGVLEYLIERPKVDSLNTIATHNVARYVKNKADVEALEIPMTERQFLAGFVDDEDI